MFQTAFQSAFQAAHRCAMALAFSAIAGLASATMVQKTVEYKVGDMTMKGFAAYDDAVKTPRPGVLVFPEWWGLTEYPKTRARELATMGYIAFVADMYGDGKTTDNPAEATKLSTEAKAGTAMRDRVTAALAELKKLPGVDPARLGAIGFCFGGACALDLAYSGADLKGVVTFHGTLTAPKPADAINTSILVLHGADDTFESPEMIQAFQKAMNTKNVDWEMDYYGHAVHAFSNPDADKYKIPGVAYNAAAARRSWETMQRFFQERFAN